VRNELVAIGDGTKIVVVSKGGRSPLELAMIVLRNDAETCKNDDVRNQSDIRRHDNLGKVLLVPDVASKADLDALSDLRSWQAAPRRCPCRRATGGRRRRVGQPPTVQLSNIPCHLC
jgi:hypothetical protein